MPRVPFPRHLNIHFPDLRDADAEGTALTEVVATLDTRWPGLAGDLVDDCGAAWECLGHNSRSIDSVRFAGA